MVAFQDDLQVATLVTRIVAANSPEQVRVTLLEAMSCADRDRLPAASHDALRAALSSSSDAVRAQALRTINALQLTGLDDALAALVRESGAADRLRLEAVRAWARRKTILDPDAFAVLLRHLDRTNDALSRLGAK